MRQFSLVLIQVLVLVVWFVIKGPEIRILHPVPDIAFRACTQLVDLHLLIGLVYPFLLIIICTIIATVNRNVPTGFNETQYIGKNLFRIWYKYVLLLLQEFCRFFDVHNVRYLACVSSNLHYKSVGSPTKSTVYY